MISLHIHNVSLDFALQFTSFYAYIVLLLQKINDTTVPGSCQLLISLSVNQDMHAKIAFLCDDQEVNNKQVYCKLDASLKSRVWKKEKRISELEHLKDWADRERV